MPPEKILAGDAVRVLGMRICFAHNRVPDTVRVT